MFGELARNRSLIVAFATRDLRTRYRASALGWAWSLLQPLASLAIYAAVFSLVFRITAPPMGSGDNSSYALFLFTGMVTWNLFSGVLNISMASLRGSGDLLRKVHFPAWAPVIGSNLVQLVQVGLELSVLLGWLLIVGNVGLSWLAAPVVLLALALFAQGLGLILAIANARYGDVQYIVTVVLSALWFLTPALYPLSAIPESAQWLQAVVTANPLSWFVLAMQDALYTLTWPAWWTLLGLLALGIATFTGGLWVFNRSSEDIRELL